MNRKKKKPQKNTESALRMKLQDELTMALAGLLRDQCLFLRRLIDESDDKALTERLSFQQAMYADQSVTIFALLAQVGAAKSGLSELRDMSLDKSKEAVFDQIEAGEDPIEAFRERIYGGASDKN